MANILDRLGSQQTCMDDMLVKHVRELSTKFPAEDVKVGYRGDGICIEGKFGPFDYLVAHRNGFNIDWGALQMLSKETVYCLSAGTIPFQCRRAMEDDLSPDFVLAIRNLSDSTQDMLIDAAYRRFQFPVLLVKGTTPSDKLGDRLDKLVHWRAELERVVTEYQRESQYHQRSR